MQLSIRAMWAILERDSIEVPSRVVSPTGLFDQSLVQSGGEQASDDQMVQIVVASTPDVLVDTSDGEQMAPLTSEMISHSPEAQRSVGTSRADGVVPANNNNDMSNNIISIASPWLLWDDHRSANDFAQHEWSSSGVGDLGGVFNLDSL